MDWIEVSITIYTSFRKQQNNNVHNVVAGVLMIRSFVRLFVHSFCADSPVLDITCYAYSTGSTYVLARVLYVLARWWRVLSLHDIVVFNEYLCSAPTFSLSYVSVLVGSSQPVCCTRAVIVGVVIVDTTHNAGWTQGNRAW